MVELEQFGSVSGLAVFIVVVVQVLKAVLPLSEEQKTRVWPWLPLVAIALGLVLAPVIGLALGRITTPALLLSWVLGGILAGTEAVGVYETTVDKVKRIDLSSGPRVTEPEY